MQIVTDGTYAEFFIKWHHEGLKLNGALMQLTPQASKTHLPEEAGRLSKRAASDVSSDTYILSIDTSSYFSVAKIP